MPVPIEIAIDPDPSTELRTGLADRLALGILVLEGVDNTKERPEIRAAVDGAAADLRRRFETETGRSAVLVHARRLYSSLGIDPTKHRPSSEALIRRLASDRDFPRISPLVDAVNLASVSTRLPLGLYDLDRVEPPVVARVGRPGEGYAGIRKAFVSLDGRPALFDARGPFGNPTSDSDRTKTTPGTTRALVVIYGLPETPYAKWERLLGVAEETIRLHVPATCAQRKVVSGTGAGTGTCTGTEARARLEIGTIPLTGAPG